MKFIKQKTEEPEKKSGEQGSANGSQIKGIFLFKKG